MFSVGGKKMHDVWAWRSNQSFLTCIYFPSFVPPQSEMGLATEQLSKQLLEYEKKVSRVHMLT